MFAQSLSPENLTPTDLDSYLEKGWFRMGQSIFTTNFIHFKSELYSTIWLRLNLDDYLADRTQLKLFKRNARFKTSFQPAIITAEKEELYERYQQSVPFHPSESLHHLLLGQSNAPSIYTTYEISVYDGDSLIAIGFFDIGENSAAGITSVYDPNYKKYSLGKYLIYKKIEYCKNNGMHHFYPGYFVPGYSFFDYKLTIANSVLEFFQLRSKQWLSIDRFSEESNPYDVMTQRLSVIQHFLQESNVVSQLVKYEFFDANLIPALSNQQLFDYPLFIYCPSGKDENAYLVLVFDVCDEAFHILLTTPIWKSEIINPDTSFYSLYFLQVINELYSTPNAKGAERIFRNLVQTIS